MATNKKQKSVEKVDVNESIYTAEELVKNHAVLGTYREIVEVSLRLAGKKAATLSEAKTIIENFKNKEV